MPYVKVECSNCLKINSIKCTNFNWAIVESNERQMGRENMHVAEYDFRCDCNAEIIIKFECWEYPEGVRNHTEQTASGGTIIENECEKCPAFGA